MKLKNLLHHYFKLITAAADDCPICGGRLLLRNGRFGPFYGCENYGRTKCRGNKNVQQYEMEKRRENNSAVPSNQTRPAPQPQTALPRRPSETTPIISEDDAIEDNIDTRVGVANNVPSSTLDNDKGEYVLVISKQDKKPYACKQPLRQNGFYTLQSETGKIEIFSHAKFNSTFDYVKDANKNFIARKNPQELFSIYKDLQTNDDGEENADQTTRKGRIPADKISEYQANIQNTFMGTDKNIMINALAGTGKTTLLRHLASFDRTGQKWLYLVYNHQNEQEAIRKFPPDIEILTTHKFAGKIIRESDIGDLRGMQFYKKSLSAIKFGLGQTRPGESKVATISTYYVQKSEKPWTTDYQLILTPFEIGSMTRRATSFVSKLADLAKSFAIKLNTQDYNQAGRKIKIVTNTDEILGKLSVLKEKYHMDGTLKYINDFSNDNDDDSDIDIGRRPDYTELLFDLTIAVLRDCLPGYCESLPVLAKYSDFNDMLWHPTLFENIRIKKYDVVLADEVQDFNDCQTYILRKLSEAGAKIVAVGDPNQSMYEFRGADSQSFRKVKETLEAAPNGSIQMPLNKNYRSAPAIIDFVRENTHVKDIEAGLTHEGLVTNQQHDQSSALSMIFQEVAQHKKPLMSSVFIARTNKSLIEPALECLANNVDFEIVGVDMLRDVVSFIVLNTSNRELDSEANLDKACEYLRNISIEELPQIVKESTEAFAREHGGDPRFFKRLREQNRFEIIIDKIVANLAEMQFYDENYEEKIYSEEKRKYEWVKSGRSIKNGYDLYKWIAWKFRTQSREEKSLDAAEDENKNPISFTTAHKSKGLEWERSFILEIDKFQKPDNKQENRQDQNTEEIDQETSTQDENTKYVAFTRAMKHMHILKPKKDKMASAILQYGWYKKAQLLTPQQIDLYHNFQAPSAVKLIGSGMGASFSIPGLGAVIRGSDLMNQVINKLRPVLTKNNVHTIDTNPVSRSDAIGLAVSSEPGTVHVDVAKIINQIKNQSLPSITQLDGTRMDADAKKSVIDRISGIILQQLGETAAHESKHNIDYFASFPKGKFESSESGAEGFGQQIAKQHFPLNFTANIK